MFLNKERNRKTSSAILTSTPDVLEGLSYFACLIQGRDFLENMIKQQDSFWKGCKTISLNGQEVDKKKLLEVDWKENVVFLKLVSRS